MANFKVIKIVESHDENFVVASVVYDNNEKIYDYKRNCRKKIDGNLFFMIDGYEVLFTKSEGGIGEPATFKVLNQGNFRKAYETKGHKRMDSSSKTKDTEQEDCSFEIPSKKETYVEDAEVKHEKYEQIKVCVENDIPVYLAGPAGSGKNHTLEQIAKELGWNFYFSNSVQQEYKLTGFIDAGGNFHETEFYKACLDSMDGKDSIFFLDEMDASIPEVLVLLNAAIANGYFEFPNGKIDLSKVHFVAAGNTFGSGADELYTGRMVLDQATLDRFAIIEFDYSPLIEIALAKGNTDLVHFVRMSREIADRNGIRMTFSYRCITMVVKLEKAGMKLEEILRIAVFKGMDKDTLNTMNFIGISKYVKAFNKMKRAA